MSRPAATTPLARFARSANKIWILRQFESLYVDPSAGSKLPGIQGVRALAAGSILALHVWFDSRLTRRLIPLGHVGRYVPSHLAPGVTLLVILSGFLLYRPFAAAVMRGRRLPDLERLPREPRARHPSGVLVHPPWPDGRAVPLDEMKPRLHGSGWNEDDVAALRGEFGDATVEIR